MKSSIFLPKTIKVGYQNRKDCYTGKLAYVIYYDEKGKLRKETSWENWRSKNIEPEEFKNIPTDGFVLNKKVGDYKSDWNHRMAYVRVYDPRNFEFEISVENLLYILENCNSIKGKGLEGEFVYGWEGTELILIPTSSPDYKEISEYSEVINENKTIKAKDLIIGATYRDRDNKDWVYMGKFFEWSRDYDSYREEKVPAYKKSRTKKFWFANPDETARRYSWRDSLDFFTRTSLGNKFIAVVSEECVPNYANLMDRIEKQVEHSPEDRVEYIDYTFKAFKARVEEDELHETLFYSKKYNNKIYVKSPYDFNDDKEYKLQSYDQYTSYWHYNKEYLYKSESLENIYDELQPQWKKFYLANGKFYREEK